MVFSDPVFLFLFLPMVLLTYALVPQSAKNLLLLLSSLFFYAWGEELFVVVLLLSIGLNYVIGLRLGRAAAVSRRKLWLWIGIAANLGLLGYFKYFGFMMESLGLEAMAERAPRLPIGISFSPFRLCPTLLTSITGGSRCSAARCEWGFISPCSRS